MNTLLALALSTNICTTNVPCKVLVEQVDDYLKIYQVTDRACEFVYTRKDAKAKSITIILKEPVSCIELTHLFTRI